MFSAIFLFDLKANLKRPSTWIFFTIFFVITALILAISGGLIGSMKGENNELFNSPLGVAQIINGVMNTSFIGLVILVAIIGPAIQKDFQYNSHSIYFTKPISKFGYVVGRFLSGIVTAAIVLSGCLLAFAFMCGLPFFDASLVGSYSEWQYLQGFVYLVLPNLLFVGALFFSVVTFTRNMLAGYITAIVLIVLTGVATAMLSDIDNTLIPSLIDPYGNTALNDITQYWSAAEKNTLSIPFTGVLVYNRLLWLAVAALLFFITYLRFNFEQSTSTIKWFSKKQQVLNAVAERTQSKLALPKVTSLFDDSLSWRLYTSLTKLEYKNLIKSPFFIIMALLTCVVIIINYFDGNNWYGTKLYPVTYNMTENISSIINLFGIIIIVFYAGVLVWRERDAKMDEIISATPIKNWVLLTSKITSLTFMYLTIIVIAIVLSILMQLVSSFFDIQLVVYIKSLFGYGLVGLVFIVSLCVAIQTFVSNRFVGYFLCIVVLVILPLVLQQMDVHNDLLKFNSSGPQLAYSDMNGFGHRLFPFLMYKSYWLAFIAILLIAANLLWSRGKERNFKARLLFAKHSMATKHYLGFCLAFVAMAGFGGFIYYNTRVINAYSTHDEEEENLAMLEKKFKHYQNLPKLKITDITVDLAIYPEQRSAVINGIYWLKNKGTQAVDTVFITYNQIASNPKLTINNNTITEALLDTVHGIKIICFAKPIAVGDSVQMKFSANITPVGFKNADAGTRLVANGTFLNSNEVLLGISYPEGMELDDKVKRAKFGLKPKDRMHNVTETAYLQQNIINPDADWVNYECTLSTSANQTAISPGYLVKKWTADNRNYFHYKMDKKILNFMSFQSACYEIKTKMCNGVNIEIYYDKHHPYNVDKMIVAAEKSLAYYNANYTPFQFKQLRIMEFPRYAQFAQSFANTIPFSEAIGFIANPDFTDPEAVDYTYFVTAHEIAHQWWGHQVIGANVKGGTVFMESFAEYSALRVMEKEYGKKAMRKFLSYELKQYLQGRAMDDRDEDVLMSNQGQTHIHYQKGAMVMFGISDLIGEKAMNNVMKAFTEKNAYQEPPYTTAVDFVTMLKAATPDSLKYAVIDGFEKITLFENRAKDITFTKLANGKYKVKVIVEALKLYANGKGKKTEATMNDYIDVGVFAKGKTDKDSEELINVKRKIKTGINTFEFIVNKEPYEAGIDPYNKLIDRDVKDNRRKVSDKKPLRKIDLADGSDGAEVHVNL
jgi:ABC-2 type transport system permease protein